MKDLSTEEREAIQAYAKRHGRTWKHQLRLAWERASDLLRRKVNSAAGECALEILDLLGVSTATIEEYLKENT